MKNDFFPVKYKQYACKFVCELTFIKRPAVSGEILWWSFSSGKVPWVMKTVQNVSRKSLQDLLSDRNRNKNFSTISEETTEKQIFSKLLAEQSGSKQFSRAFLPLLHKPHLHQQVFLDKVSLASFPWQYKWKNTTSFSLTSALVQKLAC